MKRNVFIYILEISREDEKNNNEKGDLSKKHQLVTEITKKVRGTRGVFRPK